MPNKKSDMQGNYFSYTGTYPYSRYLIHKWSIRKLKLVKDRITGQVLFCWPYRMKYINIFWTRFIQSRVKSFVSSFFKNLVTADSLKHFENLMYLWKPVKCTSEDLKYIFEWKYFFHDNFLSLASILIKKINKKMLCYIYIHL